MRTPSTEFDPTHRNHRHRRTAASVSRMPLAAPLGAGKRPSVLELGLLCCLLLISRGSCSSSGPIARGPRSLSAAFQPAVPAAIATTARRAAAGVGQRTGQPPLLASLQPIHHRSLLGPSSHHRSSIMARHNSLQTGTAEDDGAPAGAGGLLLHAFTLIGKSTRWTVAGLVGAVLLWRRDAAVVTFTAGAILNALFGKVLKRIIKESRPDGAVLEDPGMPSSHAMALFYMTAFLTKALCEGKGAGLPMWWPTGYVQTIALILVYVAVASSWRVHSGLHTPAQILVGAGVGSAVGAGWQEFCKTQLDARILQCLSRFPGSQVPLPYLAGVMVVGALTVGSVERKISKAMKRIRVKVKGRGKEKG